MKQKLTIYGDGGSRENPGEAAYGFAIFNEEDGLVFSEGKKIGINTNNVAEYSAVINALKWVLSNMPESSITFCLDSQLVASQMSGKYKVKHPNMKELFIKAKQLETQLQVSIEYTPYQEKKIRLQINWLMMPSTD